MKRSFFTEADAAANKAGERVDIMCRDWKVNEKIASENLKLNLPPGVRIHGKLDEFKKNLIVKKDYFVRPVTTELQRKLLGNVHAYAEIDVASFVDVNTHQITPAAFDFDAFRKDLRAIPPDGVENRTLYLKQDFGAVSADNTLGEFIRRPLEAICKRSGFAKARSSSTYHNDGVLWKPPVGNADDSADENDLAKEGVGVFPVKTTISRRILGEVDYLIEPVKTVPTDAKQIIDDNTRKKIVDALLGDDVIGKSVRVKIWVGDRNFRNQGNPDLPQVSQDSDVQIELADFLKKIGFGKIVIQARHGFTNFNSRYERSDVPGDE